MRCPSCGANVDSAYCGYCGTKMPIERVETQSINGDHVVINNYYYQQPSSGEAQAPSSRSMGPETAAYVNVNVSYPNVSGKSRLVALLLFLFLGIFGAHRFYVGRYLLGVLYFFTIGLFGIGYFVDLILILAGRMKDRYGLYVANWN